MHDAPEVAVNRLLNWHHLLQLIPVVFDPIMFEISDLVFVYLRDVHSEWTNGCSFKMVYNVTQNGEDKDRH